MKKASIILSIIVIGIITLAGCGSSQESSGEAASVSSQQQETQTQEPQEEETPIELVETYTTKFMDVMAVTYPNFQISYPKNWTLSDDNVDADTGETFTLTSDNGGQIQFYHFITDTGLGSKVASATAEIFKADDSDFVPGMIQGSDLSSLGNFSVMKIATTELMRIHEDGSKENEKVDMPDNECTYAVLPDSMSGTMECNKPGSAQFAFNYGDDISIVATPPESGSFTDQELKEVLAILKSFKVVELN